MNNCNMLEVSTPERKFTPECNRRHRSRIGRDALSLLQIRPMRSMCSAPAWVKGTKPSNMLCDATAEKGANYIGRQGFGGFKTCAYAPQSVSIGRLGSLAHSPIDPS